MPLRPCSYKNSTPQSSSSFHCESQQRDNRNDPSGISMMCGMQQMPWAYPDAPPTHVSGAQPTLYPEAQKSSPRQPALPAEFGHRASPGQ